MQKLQIYSFLLHSLLLFECLKSIDCKSQYVMPILGGMKMSLPYDIANIFIRPIAGSISTFLSICMLFIMVFGVITSPFGYMFGIPSRKYVLGGPTNPIESEVPTGRSLDSQFLNVSWAFSSESNDDVIFPKFEEQFFYLLPPAINTDECKLLALCHAHSAMESLPESVIKVVRIFSEKMIELSDEHQEAIKTGLRNKADCHLMYCGCKESVPTILIKTVLHWLPDFMKNHSHRRKQGMYM